jgi:DNA/RNA-binding domain of Phe-tRNA-synthetase-like protein
MYFRHADAIWADHPQLAAGALAVEDVSADADVDSGIASLAAIARSRLAETTEGELPEIQAWRRTFARMGLKPTQYRCASEALLRRFRKEGSLPRIHPLVDLCNAVSLAFAIPVAVFDIAAIDGYLEVRYATGTEKYLTFAGEIESPAPHEVIFVDRANNAHARRWTNRQSAASAVRAETRSALVVAEALHSSGRADVAQLVETIADAVSELWATPATALLARDSPRFAVTQHVDRRS